MAGDGDGRSGEARAGGRRALVTGGAGFIGSHLVEVLLGEGSEVTVVDDLSTGRRENLPEGGGRLTLIEGRVRDALEGLDAGAFDEVYHLAAAVGVELVVREPIRSIETNVVETAALLAWLRGAASGGRAVPVLIASSSEVYGKGSRTPMSEEDDVVYGPTTVGRWSYALSKALDEYLALASHRQAGVPAVVARFFNTVGPRQTGRYGMVLPRFVGAALRGEPLPVYGDGRQVRCFCDVRDVAGVLPRLVRTPGCHGRVFNVGSDRRVTILELADLVLGVVGSGSGTRLVPYDEVFGPGFEDLMCREPDLSRIRSAVGFEARISLEQTVRDVAAWMRSAGEVVP